MRTVESVIYTVGIHGKTITTLILLGTILIIGMTAVSSAENLAAKMQNNMKTALVISR